MIPRLTKSRRADCDATHACSSERSPALGAGRFDAWLTARKHKFILIPAVLTGVVYAFYQAHLLLRPASTVLIIDATVALAIGLILAFALDAFQAGRCNLPEIEAISGLKSLGRIPHIRHDGVGKGPELSPVIRNVRVLSCPKSEFAEAIRALRTSLLLPVAGREPRVILLTSATPAEGKTTVSVNLACVLAQRDVRVLLIDADLRRPTIHHRFGLTSKIGLTSILTRTSTLKQAVQRVPELANLDILVSGPVPPFPAEIIDSDAMCRLLDEARANYTYILIDSAPLLAANDSVALARNTDAVMLLVRQGKSGKHAIRRAHDLLLRAGATVSGIALNGVAANQRRGTRTAAAVAAVAMNPIAITR